MKSYKYVLVDWDGTLVNTLPLWMNAYKSVFAEFNLHPSVKEIIATTYGDWYGPKKFGIVGDDYELFNKKLQKYVNANFPNCKLVKNADYILKKIKSENKELCLITSSSRETITNTIKNKNIEHLFDAMVTGNDVTHHKPHPEPIHIGLKMLNADPEKSIMVGDMDKDVESANNAHVDSVLFFPALHRKYFNLEKFKAHNPTYVIRDLKELEKIVSGQ